MAPFQYPAFSNAAAGSIGDILQRRGELAAAAERRIGAIMASSASRRGEIEAGNARRVGELTANAQAQSGQLWGQAIAGMGQAFGQIPGQVRAAEQADLQKRAMSLEVEGRERQKNDLLALDKAYGQGGREAVLQSLQESGAGHLIPDVTKSFDAFDKAHAEAAKLQEEADAAKTAAFARGAMGVRSHNYEPQAAQLLISDLKQKYAKDPRALAQLDQFQKGLLDNPTPEAVKAMIDPILQADPKTREDLLRETRDLQTKTDEDERRRLQQQNLEREKAADLERQQNDQALREQGKQRIAIEGRNASTAAARESREQKVFDQTYGTNGTNAAVDANGNPISGTAKAIAEYRLAPLTGRAATSGPGKAIMDQVAAYNPSYDATQYTSRSAMRKAFTSGNQSQQLGALNTAIEHLGVLNDMAQGLQNGEFKPGNELYNKVATMFGSEAATNFNFARDIMSGELATAMKKSGATDTEIDKVTRSLEGSGSPAQLAGAIRTVAIPMIGGKARVMNEQYHATMGDKDPFSVFTPGAQRVLATLGGGPPSTDARNAPPAPRPGYIRVVGPNGETGQMPQGGTLPAGWRKQ